YSSLMSLIFKTRSLAPERMDTEFIPPDELAQILRTLETINIWLGGWRATLRHLQGFSRHWVPGQTIRLIDWGAGGADILRAIVRWARGRGFPVEIVGVDNNPAVLAYAKAACRD